MMDREGKPLTPERVSPDPRHFDEALTRLREAQAHADASTLPDRPYAPDDENCVFCPFRTQCWELEARIIVWVYPFEARYMNKGDPIPEERNMTKTQWLALAAAHLSLLRHSGIQIDQETFTSSQPTGRKRHPNWAGDGIPRWNQRKDQLRRKDEPSEARRSRNTNTRSRST